MENHNDSPASNDSNNEIELENENGVEVENDGEGASNSSSMSFDSEEEKLMLKSEMDNLEIKEWRIQLRYVNFEELKWRVNFIEDPSHK